MTTGDEKVSIFFGGAAQFFSHPGEANFACGEGWDETKRGE